MPSKMSSDTEWLPASKQSSRKQSTPKDTPNKRKNTPAPNSKLKNTKDTSLAAQLMTLPDVITPGPVAKPKKMNATNAAAQLMTPPDTVSPFRRNDASSVVEESSPVITKAAKERKISDVTFEDGSSIDEPEDPILRKQRRRRRNSDKPFRDPGSDGDTEDEYVLKRRAKRRKNSDGVFKAPETPTDSGDHNLGPMRATRNPARSAQKYRSPAVIVKTERHTPELTVKTLFEHDQRLGSPAPRFTSSPILTLGTTPAPTQTSNQIEDVRASSRKRRRYEAVVPRDSAAKVKREPSSSRSNTARKPSQYTQADAIRDAEQDELDSDLQEPSPKKLKNVVMRYTNSRLEKARQRRQELRSRKSGEMAKWSEAEIRLFDKLDMRGLDPHLPSSWARDFTTMQPRVFARYGEYSSVRTMATHRRKATGDFRASKAFRKLVDLGSYARDKTTLRQRPEKILRRGIKNYIRWSHIDAQLDQAAFLDHLVVVKDDTDVAPNPRAASEKLTRKLKRLARHHRQAYYKEKNVRDWRDQSEDLSQDPLTPMTPTTVATTTFTEWSENGSYIIEPFIELPEQPQPSGFSWWQRLFRFFMPFDKNIQKAQGSPENDIKEKMLNERFETYLNSPDVSILDFDAASELGSETSSDMGALYGILISHLVVQIVALPIADPNAEVHSLLICDYNQASMDNWNALAVAITVCHARDDILKDAVPLHESQEEDDTDA